MIEVHVNGRMHTLRQGMTLRDLLASIGVDPDQRGIAVALNGEVVPRSAWVSTIAERGAAIEIVGATQGG